MKYSDEVGESPSGNIPGRKMGPSPSSSSSSQSEGRKRRRDCLRKRKASRSAAAAASSGGGKGGGGGGYWTTEEDGNGTTMFSYHPGAAPRGGEGPILRPGIFPDGDSPTSSEYFT